MADAAEGGQYDYFADLNIRIRDLEEKQRLLKDRVVLVGQSFVEQRDKTFNDIQELKQKMTTIEIEQRRIKELLKRIAEQVDQFARREELMIVQRQLDLLREPQVARSER